MSSVQVRGIPLMSSTIPLIADCIYCDPSTVSSITLECNELSMKLRIGKTPSRFREFSLDENADLAGGKSGSSRNSAQIRTGFWGILGVDSLSVEVGRRSTCVGRVSAIDGARAPTRRLVVLECGISRVITNLLKQVSTRTSHGPCRTSYLIYSLSLRALVRVLVI